MAGRCVWVSSPPCCLQGPRHSPEERPREVIIEWLRLEGVLIRSTELQPFSVPLVCTWLLQEDQGPDAAPVLTWSSAALRQQQNSPKSGFGAAGCDSWWLFWLWIGTAVVPRCYGAGNSMSSVTAQHFSLISGIFRHCVLPQIPGCCSWGWGVEGEQIFMFSSQMANAMQIGFYLFLQKIVFSYTPEAWGERENPMFWELAILISTAASFVLFSYMLLDFFLHQEHSSLSSFVYSFLW